MAVCQFCGLEYAGEGSRAENKHLKNDCKKNPYVVGSCFDAPLAKKQPKNNSGSLNSGSVVFEQKKKLEETSIHVLSDRASANRGESQTSATTATIRQTNTTTGLTSVSATSATSANPVAKTHPPSATPTRGADGGVMVSPPNLAGGIKPIKLRDFKPQNPKSWIVQDVLGAGTLAVLGGKRATFKSTISVSLAARVAAGLPFLGHHCDKVPVLYMDEENGDAHLYDLFTNTVKPLGAEFEPPCLDNVQIICGQGVSKLWDTMAALDPEDADCPKLIIMDGLRRFLGTANENDAGEVSKFMQTAKYEAERLGACILFLHHARKSQSNGGKQSFDEFEDAMDSLRGSSDIMASVSTAMITTRVGDSTKVMVSFPKTRWGKEPPPVGIEFIIDDDAIQLTLTGEDNQTDFVMTQNAQIIRSWAIKGQHDVFTSEQVKNGLTGRLGVRTIERILPWMLDAQWIRKQKKGVYEIDLPASGQQQIGCQISR